MPGKSVNTIFHALHAIFRKNFKVTTFMRTSSVDEKCEKWHENRYSEVLEGAEFNSDIDFYRVTMKVTMEENLSAGNLA